MPQEAGFLLDNAEKLLVFGARHISQLAPCDQLAPFFSPDQLPRVLKEKSG